MSRTRIDIALMAAGGLALIGGSFLPWAELLNQGVSGIDGGDGWMTVTAAAVFMAFAVRVFLDQEPLPLWLGWAALLVAIAVAGINLLDILDTGGDDVAVGTGMMLMVLGGFLGVVGLSDYGWRESSQTK